MTHTNGSIKKVVQQGNNRVSVPFNYTTVIQKPVLSRWINNKNRSCHPKVFWELLWSMTVGFFLDSPNHMI
jgi:hypothetical protein